MGQIVKAGPNTASYPTYPPKENEVKAWMIGRAAEDAAKHTADAYQAYITGPFNTWRISYDSSRAEEPAPQPPNGISALMSDDGFSYTMVDSGVPAGPVGPYVKKVVAPSSPMKAGGAPAFGGLFFGPLGVIVDQIDGTKWQRVA